MSFQEQLQTLRKSKGFKDMRKFISMILRFMNAFFMVDQLNKWRKRLC